MTLPAVFLWAFLLWHEHRTGVLRHELTFQLSKLVLGGWKPSVAAVQAFANTGARDKGLIFVPQASEIIEDLITYAADVDVDSDFIYRASGHGDKRKLQRGVIKLRRLLTGDTRPRISVAAAFAIGWLIALIAFVFFVQVPQHASVGADLVASHAWDEFVAALAATGLGSAAAWLTTIRNRWVTRSDSSRTRSVLSTSPHDPANNMADSPPGSMGDSH